jgi:hypothetical protein
MADLPLYKTMSDLIAYARDTNLQCPKIRLAMTRIRESHASKQTIRLFNAIRKLGIIVDTMDNIPTVHISDAVTRIAPLKATSVMFSDTLLLDCTLLVSLCSDITAGAVEPQHWHTVNVKHQIQDEVQHAFLPVRIFPIIKNKRLVCTRVAYNKLIDVLGPIGTVTEKRRATLLFPQVQNECFRMTPEERIGELQTLSKYPTSHMVLPMNMLIEIFDVDTPSIMAHLPPVAQKIASELSETGMSVTTLETLLYSWATGFTTLSSNNEALKKIRYRIKQYRGGDTSIVGPEVWIFAPARNLVGDYYIADRSLIPKAWKERLAYKAKKKAEMRLGRNGEVSMAHTP